MNKTWMRALIALVVAFLAYQVGIAMIDDLVENENLIHIAAMIAGGSYWIGSKD